MALQKSINAEAGALGGPPSPLQQLTSDEVKRLLSRQAASFMCKDPRFFSSWAFSFALACSIGTSTVCGIAFAKGTHSYNDMLL